MDRKMSNMTSNPGDSFHCLLVMMSDCTLHGRLSGLFQTASMKGEWERREDEDGVLCWEWSE